uniref:SMP-30/Gluconolactonase/LRE-like region domain-containing protein n=1 Tax=Branchiostoma floridae TaxID=7739 RepID=C3Z036_BRAFL|eukprot:XP_002598083.1 hypothetical protein BRAFLDRAFT_85700 [Branchiostoma floridae]
MAEDSQSDAVPNVVEKEFLSDSITNPGTEAVQPIPRQPDEDIDLHIPDEQLSIKSDAAAENRQTIDISPGVLDTYAIAYICHDHITYETTTVATIVASNSSHNDDLNLAGCGASENDSDTSVFIRNDSTAHTETRDPNPMYTQSTVGPPPNDVTPNPMYTESVMNPNDATTNPMYTESIMDPSSNEDYRNPMYTESTMDPSSNEDNPNPTYTQSTMDPPPNDVNPNPMYLPSTMGPNVSPGPASKSNDNPQISTGKCEGNDHKDENGQAINISPGDSDTYAIAYICKGDVGPGQTFSSNNSDGTQPSPATRLEDAASQQQGDFERSNIGNNPRLRPYAVRCLRPFRKSVVESASCDVTQPHAVKYQEEIAESANNDSDPYIQPYAVGYQKDDESPNGAPDCEPAASDSINNDVLTNPSSNDPNTPDVVSEERQHVPNALNPNPMYVPNVQHPAACENNDKKLETITFGGPGRKPGKFINNFGVAVSADNEIFVTDASAERVQVFSITGTYLRLFRTEVPGTGRKMKPYTVAIDVEPDYLWVAGIIRRFLHRCVHVVQYHKEGRPLKTFGLRSNTNYLPSAEIAIDVRNNKVILGEGDKIMMFQPNGSLVWSLRAIADRRIFPISGVASDCEGNVVLADWHRRIKVYNHFGNKILEFVGTSAGNGRIGGISVDPLGRIIVASTHDNRVDMFTSRGEFVRTTKKLGGSTLLIPRGGKLNVM